MKKSIAMFCAVAALGLSGCASSEIAGKGNSAIGAKAHINSTSYGLKLLFMEPLAGSPTIDDAVNELTRAAKENGSGKVRIVQSNSSNLWWIFPPISIIVNPVICNAAGDAE